MTIHTIFDVASLTKVIATSTAVMQLVELGKLNLEDPVVKYWPEFKGNGKERDHACAISDTLFGPSTVSGPEAQLVRLRHRLRMIEEEKPLFPPGTNFIYSDINFIYSGRACLAPFRGSP